jgi:hypothetical protein
LALLAACATPRWPATPAALAPTSSAAIPADCPAANPSASLPDRSSGLAPADAVSRYLDQGGDPAAAIAGLVGLGWVSSSSKAVWTDLDGDESLDLVAGLVSDPDDPATPAAGGVFAWQCRGGGYVRTEFAPPRAGYEPPALREARDLTGDGVAELVVAYPSCGAHTCFAQFAVYLWDGTSWVDRFRGASDDIPTPELSIETGNPSAPSTLEITATGIGSVGAGPFRSWSRSWSWDDPAQVFVAGPAVLEPPR